MFLLKEWSKNKYLHAVNHLSRNSMTDLNHCLSVPPWRQLRVLLFSSLLVFPIHKQAPRKQYFLRLSLPITPPLTQYCLYAFARHPERRIHIIAKVILLLVALTKFLLTKHLLLRRSLSLVQTQMLGYWLSHHNRSEKTMVPD